MKKQENFSEIEWAIYKKWFDYLNSLFSLQLNGVIYLKTDPLKSQERIRKRSRDEESDINLDYLKDINDLHDDWLC